MRLLRFIITIPKKILLLLIWVYQHTVSPDHGPMKSQFPGGYCKFTPSCSEYGYQAIQKYGVIRGLPRVVWRILRCNPWSKGGIDKP
ncbi:MAG TPA: membrane protein insertion efficiency factor YidD [Candidatus Magasanikbacteria bacterium]|nr:membrane protein insertion efficiency factor YidD [Candidatus Magasanikbacteria bacterium]